MSSFIHTSSGVLAALVFTTLIQSISAKAAGYRIGNGRERQGWPAGMCFVAVRPATTISVSVTIQVILDMIGFGV
jgi:hypothetical protein